MCHPERSSLGPRERASVHGVSGAKDLLLRILNKQKINHSLLPIQPKRRRLKIASKALARIETMVHPP